MSWTEIGNIRGPSGLPGERGPEGPQGPPGADSTVPGPEGPAGLVRVLVETGSEDRPNIDFVIWVGGDSKPVNMQNGDLWLMPGTAAPATPPSITTISINSLVVGTPYTQTLTASGTGPFSWSATGLPVGLTLNPSTGVLSGSPSSTGSGTASVSVTGSGGSSSKQLTWSVVAAATAPTVLASPELPSMTVGVPVSWSPGHTGSTPMTWGVTSGALPAGLAINTSTGAVSGSPEAAGPINFSLTATNSVGTGSRSFTGTVSDPVASGGVVSIFGDNLPGDLSYHDDASAGSWLAHQFYVPAEAASMASAQIVGARFYALPGSPIVGQTWRIGLVRRTAGNGGIIRVGGGDFGGQDVLSTNGAMTVGPALTAGWNELMFSQEWPGLAPNEGVIIGVMIGTGVQYLFNTSLPQTAIQSQSGASIVMAEAGTVPSEANRSFYRGNPAAGAVRWYGIDILLRTS